MPLKSPVLGVAVNFRTDTNYQFWTEHGFLRELWNLELGPQKDMASGCWKELWVPKSGISIQQHL